MLAISGFKQVFERYATMSPDRKVQAEFLSLWVQSSLGMTCNVPDGFESGFLQCHENHPAKKYLSDVKDLEEDKAHLLLSVQQHRCSAYCLRKRKSW